MLLRELPINMVEIISLCANPSVVDMGSEAECVLHIKNMDSMEGKVTAGFSRVLSDGARTVMNTQVRVVGPGETAYFRFRLHATESPGSSYVLSARVVRERMGGYGPSSSQATESVTVRVRDDTDGVIIDECSVSKVSVDGGESVSYTAVIRNGTATQRLVLMDFWDYDSGETVGQDQAWMLPGESISFKCEMECTKLGHSYLICARIVDDFGNYAGARSCAPRVEVSYVHAAPDYTLQDVRVRCQRAGISNPDGFGITARVSNEGKLGGSPWVRIETLRNVSTGEMFSRYGGTCTYIRPGETKEIEILTKPPGIGIYEMDIEIEGTGQHKSLMIDVVEGSECGFSDAVPNEGATKCDGLNLMVFQQGGWVLQKANASECGGGGGFLRDTSSIAKAAAFFGAAALGVGIIYMFDDGDWVWE